jgi:hypothetical protein
MKCPDLVFLMETKLKSKKMGAIKIWLGFENMLVVDCVRKGGGLVLIWKEGLGIKIQNYSNRHINAVVAPNNSTPWVFMGFYGHPEAHKMSEAWSLLKHLKSMAPGPWLCVGDFNEIIDQAEKIGERRRPNYLMENSKSTLEFCGFSEVECKGPRCTWNNGREGEDFMMEKLDRVVANHSWHIRYPNVDASLDVAAFSDHLPIFINLVGEKMKRRRGCGFRFEATWGDNKECKEVIKQIWKVKNRDHGTWRSVQGKLNASRRDIREWQRVNGRNMGQQIHMLSDQILEAQAAQ